MTPVHYAVRFPNPQTHYAEVDANLPTEGAAEIEVFLPVWTPGSYLVREYARHLEGFQAFDSSGNDSGNALYWEKTRKNRWRIQTGGAARVTFSYRVYCREMSVRANWVEDGFALLNGASTFVTLAGGLAREHPAREHVVALELPAHWKTSITGLPEASHNASAGTCPAHCYTAKDYDTLADSPILAGNPSVYRFEIDGIPHFLVNEGDASFWDIPRAAADLEKLIRRTRDMWGELPYGKYVFLNMIVEGGGGLEHRNSVCVMTNRWAMRTRKAYTGWLALASHEFFHVWNAKRLRPVELGPFDYENENYTRSLWVTEGFTEYYGDLMVKRAGLTDEREYLTALSGLLQALQTTPGRLVQSAAGSSFDAWIKLYRPDENSANTNISYYTKGAVIAWLLDAKIRRATGGRKSLDDLMRLAFSRYGGECGFTHAQFLTAADEVAGVSLAGFFAMAAESTQELPYDEALDWFGLRNKECEPSNKAWLGAETKADNGRLLVTKVLRGAPGYGLLDVDDEILAIDDYRVRADTLAQRLEQYRAGDRVSVLVARRERLTRVDLHLGEEPNRWQLEANPGATPEQQQRFIAWLSSGDGSPSDIIVP